MKPLGFSLEANMPAALRRLVGFRVLVVDDDEDVRVTLTWCLDVEGAEVRTASSVEQGLVQMRTWLPDVLVSDLQMPGEDGLYMIRCVRKLPTDLGGAVGTIALTGSIGSVLAARAIPAGFDLLLSKPVAFDVLVTALQLMRTKTLERVQAARLGEDAYRS